MKKILILLCFLVSCNTNKNNETFDKNGKKKIILEKTLNIELLNKIRKFGVYADTFDYNFDALKSKKEFADIEKSFEKNQIKNCIEVLFEKEEVINDYKSAIFLVENMKDFHTIENLTKVTNFYIDDKFKRKNFEKAIYYLKELSMLGDKNSDKMLASLYLFSYEFGYPQDFSLVKKYTEKYNDSSSNYYLGLIYSYGLTKEKNYEKAIAHFKNAINDSYFGPFAKYELGRIYYQLKDYKEAKKYFEEIKKNNYGSNWLENINEKFSSGDMNKEKNNLFTKSIDLNYEIEELNEFYNKVEAKEPQNNPYYHMVTSTDLSKNPDEILEKNGQKTYIYKFYGKKEKVNINFKLKTKIRSWDNFQENRDLDKSNLSKYLINEKYLEVNSAEIQKLGKALKGSTNEATLANIYSYIKNNIEYDGKKEKSDFSRYGAEKTLKLKKGVCVEFSDLFVALARANGIPSRPIRGMNGVAHQWAEAYLEDYGWTLYDPTFGQNGFYPQYVHDHSYIKLREATSLDDDTLLFKTFDKRIWIDVKVKE